MRYNLKCLKTVITFFFGQPSLLFDVNIVIVSSYLKEKTFRLFPEFFFCSVKFYENHTCIGFTILRKHLEIHFLTFKGLIINFLLSKFPLIELQVRF